MSGGAGSPDVAAGASTAGAGLPAAQEPYLWLTVALGSVLATATLLRVLDDEGCADSAL